jgi:copper chaperone CopZ
MSTTHTFSVTGMTCGHCAGAVSEELHQIPGVTDVQIQIVRGGASIVAVASPAPISESDIVAALDEAGDYALAGN